MRDARHSPRKRRVGASPCREGERGRPKECSIRNELLRNDQPLDIEADAPETGVEVPATEPEGGGGARLVALRPREAAAMERFCSSARGSAAGGIRTFASGTMPDEAPRRPTGSRRARW